MGLPPRDVLLMINHMVERSSVASGSRSELDRTFAALADSTRRALLTRLQSGPATVSDLAVPFEMSLAAVSKHLRVLENAGLVRRAVVGREHHLRLNAKPLRAAAAWTTDYREFWEQHLDALAELLQKRKRRAKHHPSRGA